MLLIYSKEPSVRLRYIAELLLKEMFSLDVRFTSDKQEFAGYEWPAICYSEEQVGNALRIVPSGLLSATETIEVYPEHDKVKDMTILFPTPGEEFPFDVFSAAFYLVTRYEEYMSSGKDKYGRFQPAASLSSQLGLMEIPIVNHWALYLVEHLKRRYSMLDPQPPSFRVVSTIDIDHAYAYRCRTLRRTLGGIARSFSRFDFSGIARRFLVLAGLRPDPYDTYAYIREVHEQYNLRPLYFMLCADYGHHDNNIRMSSRGFSSLVKDLAQYAVLGLHPSLSSNKDPRTLDREVEILNDLTGHPVRTSRQHFLRIRLPKTYRQLIRIGITDDYSMGYASMAGFRAGIASPFRFFDLPRNEATHLVVHPVSMMDVTFRDHLHLRTEDSIRRIKRIIHQVRSVNGEYVSLWHNESLSGKGRWKGWRRVFEETTKYAAECLR